MDTGEVRIQRHVGGVRRGVFELGAEIAGEQPPKETALDQTGGIRPSIYPLLMRPPHSLVRHVIPRDRYTDLQRKPDRMLECCWFRASWHSKDLKSPLGLGGRLGFLLRVIIRGRCSGCHPLWRHHRSEYPKDLE